MEVGNAVVILRQQSRAIRIHSRIPFEELGFGYVSECGQKPVQCVVLSSIISSNKEFPFSMDGCLVVMLTTDA